MESNTNEDDSKSSSEKVTSDNNSGTGRFYECVFCKRGFTTAQALGGHMNIHRRDRAKNRPPCSSSSSSSISDKFLDDNNNYASLNRSSAPLVQFYPTILDHHHQHAGMASEVHVNYQMCFPVSANNNNNNDNDNSNNHSTDYDSSRIKNNRHLNVFGDEIWRGNLGLIVGESDHHVSADDDDKEKRQGVSEEDGLDLELRLGHHDP